MAERKIDSREALILAGIEEIDSHGLHAFSVRRVAEACGMSCAAPYKHFKDKRAFIAAIADHIKRQWSRRAAAVLNAYEGDLRTQIVEICVSYVQFLMERPVYRAILMTKDNDFDAVYRNIRTRLSEYSLQLIDAAGYRKGASQRKLHLIRAFLFGTLFLIDSGELEYNEETLANLRYNIDRELTLP